MEVNFVSLVWDPSRQILTLFSWLSAIKMIFLHGWILKQIFLSCFPIFQLFWWKNEKLNFRMVLVFVSYYVKRVLMTKKFVAGSLRTLEMVFVNRLHNHDRLLRLHLLINVLYTKVKKWCWIQMQKRKKEKSWHICFAPHSHSTP